MEAIGLSKYLPITDDNTLVDLEIPKPEAKGHDLCESVTAISVNLVETKIRTTTAEAAGTITAANLRKAHAQVETGRTIGKVVLENW